MFNWHVFAKKSIILLKQLNNKAFEIIKCENMSVIAIKVWLFLFYIYARFTINGKNISYIKVLQIFEDSFSFFFSGRILNPTSIGGSDWRNDAPSKRKSWERYTGMSVPAKPLSRRIFELDKLRYDRRNHVVLAARTAAKKRLMRFRHYLIRLDGAEISW